MVTATIKPPGITPPTMRILVIGCSGSGKTTLARRLARELCIRHFSLDYLFWKPGWVESTDDEFVPRVETACSEPAWVMDGGYSRTLPLRLARADTVIWLDLPRHVCLARVVKRFLLNIFRVREDMPPGCIERLDLEFLRWIWNWHRTHKDKLRAALSEWLGCELNPGWAANADGSKRVWLGKQGPATDEVAQLANQTGESY